MHPALHSTPRTRCPLRRRRGLRHPEQPPHVRRHTSPGRRPRHRGVSRGTGRRRRLPGRFPRHCPGRPCRRPPSLGAADGPAGRSLPRPRPPPVDFQVVDGARRPATRRRGPVDLDAPVARYLPASGPAAADRADHGPPAADQTSGLPSSAIDLRRRPPPSPGSPASLAKVQPAARPRRPIRVRERELRRPRRRGRGVAIGRTRRHGPLVFGPLGMTHTTADPETAAALGSGMRTASGSASGRPHTPSSDRPRPGRVHRLDRRRRRAPDRDAPRRRPDRLTARS